MKKYLIIAVKLTIAISVLYWVIFYQLDSDERKNLLFHIKSIKPTTLLLAFCMFLTAMAIGIFRWQLLLRLQGIHIAHYQATWIAATGMFFNAFLIGVTGGDVFKAWYIAKAAPERKPQAVLSIAVDRLIGTLGLFVLAIISIFLNLPALLNVPQTRSIVFTVISSFAVVLIVIGLTTQHHRMIANPWWKRLWQYVPDKLKVLFDQLLESYKLYGRYPRTLIVTLLLSVGVHALVVLAAWVIGHDIGIKGLTLVNYFVYCPIINVIAAIPITPNGLGVREAAYVRFFSLQGVPGSNSAALSFLIYSITMALSFACGVFYLIGKPRKVALNQPKDILRKETS